MGGGRIKTGAKHDQNAIKKVSFWVNWREGGWCFLFCYVLLLDLHQKPTSKRKAALDHIVGADHPIRLSCWRKDVYEGSRIAFTVRIEFTCNKAGGPGSRPYGDIRDVDSFFVGLWR